MSNDDLILQLLKESRDAINSLTDAVNDLKIEIVGREKCDGYRKDFSCRLDDMDGRLKKLEEDRRLIGLTWDTVKNNSVLKAGFFALTLGVASPLVNQITGVSEKYGIREAAIVSAIIIIAIAIAWALMNRSATKKLLNW